MSTLDNPIRVDQADILRLFAERLMEHPLLNSATVIVDDQPVPEAFPTGGYAIVVSPGAGDFPDAIVSGAGHSQCTEDGSITIGIYARSMKDRLGSKLAALISKAPGKPSLLEWKRIVIRQLLVSDSLNVLGQPQMWEPRINGQAILKDLPLPRRATAVMDVPQHAGWRGLQVTFSCTWDWDLYRA